MEDKIIYNEDVQIMVARIYRKGSDIFQAMINGEIISGLIKQSIAKKGKNPRIGDKKKLYKLCKEQELNLQENNSVSNNI